MKCKLCDVELKERYKYHYNPNPVFGGSVPRYLAYYYCPECGLMYEAMEYK